MAEFPCRSLRARYVFTGLGPPIAGGTVTLCGPRIVAVGREARGDLEDLGNAAILPGLVNAHTHLELSDLDAPLGTPGMGLVDWIGLVIAHRQRRAQVAAGPQSPSPLECGDLSPLSAARNRPGRLESGDKSPHSKGIAESRRLGTTSLGEIAQPGWSAELFSAGRIDATVFLELIAPTAARADPVFELARGHLSPPLPPGEGRGEGMPDRQAIEDRTLSPTSPSPQPSPEGRGSHRSTAWAWPRTLPTACIRSCCGRSSGWRRPRKARWPFTWPSRARSWSCWQPGKVPSARC